MPPEEIEGQEPEEELEDALETEEMEETEEVDLDQVRAEAAQSRTSEIDQTLSQYGLAIAANGQIQIRDAHRASSFFAPQASPSPKAQTAAEPEEEELPDPLTDPAGYQKAVQRAFRAELTKATAPLIEQNQRLERLLSSGRSADAAQRVKPMLEEVGYGELADVPGFAGMYREALSQLAPEQLDDPDTLVRMALMLIPDVKRANGGKLPRAGARDGQGRFAAAKSNAARTIAGQAAPSREAGRAPKADSGSRQEQEMAQALGLSVEEVRALRDPSGQAYGDFKKRGKA